MQPTASHTELRHGIIEAGDLVHLPALATYVEVAADSIFIGSDVSTQSKVFRLKSKVRDERPCFSKPSERADFVRELDSVDLAAVGKPRKFRVVVYKDAEFVYLRKVITEKAASNTGNRVCRKTGKVWEWDGLGWNLLDGYELRVPGEATPETANSATQAYGAHLIAEGILLPGEQVFMGD